MFLAKISIILEPPVQSGMGPFPETEQCNKQVERDITQGISLCAEAITPSQETAYVRPSEARQNH